jgi:hypothetical protein
MRVVALDAIHFAFDDGMMLRKVEFRVGFQVALETGGGVLAGIDDELAASAAGHDMLAGGAVAGFATLLAGKASLFEMQPRVGAGRKGAADVRVAIHADAVANEGGALDFRRGHDRATQGRTGIDEQNKRNGTQGQRDPRQPAPTDHAGPPGCTALVRTGIRMLESPNNGLFPKN